MFTHEIFTCVNISDLKCSHVWIIHSLPRRPQMTRLCDMCLWRIEGVFVLWCLRMRNVWTCVTILDAMVCIQRIKSESHIKSIRNRTLSKQKSYTFWKIYTFLEDIVGLRCEFNRKSIRNEFNDIDCVIPILTHPPVTKIDDSQLTYFNYTSLYHVSPQ